MPHHVPHPPSFSGLEQLDPGLTAPVRGSSVPGSVFAGLTAAGEVLPPLLRRAAVGSARPGMERCGTRGWIVAFFLEDYWQLLVVVGGVGWRFSKCFFSECNGSFWDFAGTSLASEEWETRLWVINVTASVERVSCRVSCWLSERMMLQPLKGLIWEWMVTSW